MANEESNVAGVGRLLGTASLQRSLDVLNKSVSDLTASVKNSGGKAASGVASSAFGTWAKKDWNSESNYAHGRPNGGGSTPVAQPRGQAYTNTLLGGGPTASDAATPKGNGGHSMLRGTGRVALAGAGLIVASGVAQLPDRALMNTTTSMLNRTASNGASGRSIFQNNFTSHGYADTAAAAQTIQRMGFGVGTAGFNSSSQYMRTAGLVDPSISQAQSMGAMAQMQTGSTFNSLRMFGISTIGAGGKTMSPRELAHQFITKDFGANKPTSAAGIEASLGQKSRFGQSLNAMVSKGMLDANTASQVTTMMRSELNAGLKGKSYDQYSNILNKYADKRTSGSEATAALKSVGLTPTDANKLLEQHGNKSNQLDANNQAFSEGLGVATQALGEFSQALTGILSGPMGTALGRGQGFGGGIAGVAGNAVSGAGSLGTAWAGASALKWGAKAIKGGGAPTSGGIGGALGKGAKSLGKGGLAGAAIGIVGNVAGSAIKDGHHGARDIGGGALSGAATGAAIGSIGNVLGPEVGIPAMAIGAAIGGVWGGITGGQDGGAAVGQDRASGTAAKATGTVGAGKTASSVIAIAKKYLGVPYVYGGTTPKGFDCSGFTQFVFQQVGVSLPRVSQAQQTAGKAVSKKDAQAGDLVFMGGNAKTGGAHHVALMVSPSQIIEAAHTGTNIRIRSFSMDEISTVGRFLGSLGTMSESANTDGTDTSGDGADKKSKSSSVGAAVSAAFSGGLNEMDSLAGALASFLGGSVVSPSGKSSSASEAVGATGGNGSVSLAGGSGNSAKVFNTLVGAGFTAQAASGVIGNLMQESGINPNSHQGGGGPGRGIMQWTENERWATLKKWAGKRDPWSLDTQVGFMMKEMNDAGVSASMKGMTDVNKATDFFEKKMERAGTPNMAARYKYANNAYNQSKSYAVGSTNIDVDQDARVHKGEMIIPTHQAEAVRQALSGNNPVSSISGGKGGVSVTFAKDSIKVTLGAGATTRMGTQVGRSIVDAIVKDSRLADIASGI